MVLQDCIKYIATTKQRVLCEGGWKLKSRLENCQVKLFTAPSQIEIFYENTSRYVKPKYTPAKVKVRIEVLDDDCEYSD